MKPSRNNPFSGLQLSAPLVRAAFTFTVTALFACAPAQADALTWDTVPDDGATITAGSGNWNTAAGNLVWNNAGGNVEWSQTSTTIAMNSATFAGTDAALETHVVTLDTQMAASGLAFNSTGYKLEGAAGVYLPASSIIEIATGKSATIGCRVLGPNNAHSWLVRQNSEIFVTGITTGPQQPLFIGETGPGSTGKLIFSGTHSYTVPVINASVSITGGTFSATTSFMIGRGGRPAVNGVTANSGMVTLDSADATLNHNGGGTGNNTMIGRDGGVGTLVIKNGTFNTATSNNTHDLVLPQDNNVASKGTFDVQGGTVNIGSTTNITAKINFGRVGLTDTQTATMTQSGGTIASYGGILFGGTTAGTYTGTALWTMTGGSLYLGAGGIGEGTFSANESITLSGGVIGALANWTGALPMALETVNGDVTFQCADGSANPFDILLDHSLTGAGGLKKTGGGKLTLSGVNSYSGGTLVSEGTLQVVTQAVPSTNGPLALDGTAGSPVVVVDVTNSGRFWEVGALTSTGGTPAIEIQYGALSPSASVAPIKVTGNVDLTTTPLLTVGGSAIAVGTYPLIHYSGTFSGTAPTAVALPGYCSGIITHNTATRTIALVVTSSSYDPALTWAVGDGVWDINSTANWKQSGNAVKFNNGNAVNFDDTASGISPITITLNTAVAPSGVTVNSTKDHVIGGSGSISGTAGVNLLGTGTLTLANANTYSGGTVLSAGQLNINHGSAIGTGTLTINPGTLIDNTSGGDVSLGAGNTQLWNGNFSYLGTANNLHTGTGSVTLGNPVSINVAANSLTVGGPIEGDHKVTKSGGGTLVLAAANTFTGGLTVSEGGVSFTDPASIGTGVLTLGGGTIDNVSGGDLVLSPSGILLGSSFAFAGSGNLTIDGAATLQTPNTPSAISVTDKDLTFTGTVTLANTVVTKSGMGALTYSGNTSNSGGMIINEGRVNLDKSSGSVITNASGVMVNADGSLVITGDGGNQIADAESGAITPVNLNGGTFDLNGRSEKVDSLTIIGGGILRNGAASSTSALTLRTGSSITVTSSGGFEANETDGVLEIPAPIAGDGAVRKSGAGTVMLGGANAYSGDTTVIAGTLTLSNAPDPLNANPNNDASTVTITATGATLDLTFTGTDVVDKLFVGNVQLPAGTYGPGATPIQQITNSSGSGTLTVLSGPGGGFSSWITGTFAGGATVPSDKQGPYDDPDNDGISNLLEYAVADQDPTVGDPGISTFTGVSLSFSKRAGTSGLTYAIQESTDLGAADAWSEVSGGLYVNDSTTISYTFTPGTPPKNFLRLQVLSN
jgi:autotransporter-associated beta strand protein